MPAIASHVQRMTARSASERGAGLESLRSTLGALSEEQLLEVVREPGLLSALNQHLLPFSKNQPLTSLTMLYFLPLTALNVLYTLMGRESSPDSPTLQLCNSAIFDSPCFSSLKDIAASGSATLELKQNAWEAIKGVARMEEGRLTEMLDSPGMVELLQAGIESEDHCIAANATTTSRNLCFDESTATAMFDSPCFFSLKYIAASGSTQELRREAFQAIVNMSCMEEGRRREMFDYPGMLALLQTGLESADEGIAEEASATIRNLSLNETTAAAVFDSPLFPLLMDIVASGGTTLELKREAWAAVVNLAYMEEGRMREFLDCPGMVALLQNGLESIDATIAERVTATIGNLCCDLTTASALLDGYPDLVQSLVDTFSTTGVCLKFICKLQLHSPPLLPSLFKLSCSFFKFTLFRPLLPRWMQSAR